MGSVWEFRYRLLDYSVPAVFSHQKIAHVGRRQVLTHSPALLAYYTYSVSPRSHLLSARKQSKPGISRKRCVACPG